jgi:transposase InsO family protein
LAARRSRPYCCPSGSSVGRTATLELEAAGTSDRRVSCVTMHINKVHHVTTIMFAIDACDREVLAWLATSAGISGEMVRALMGACVERRFGISKAAHPVEWLSDNGSAYIAKDTLDTATALGLKLCFTPVRSPESNGTSRRHSSKLSNAIMLGSRSYRMLTVIALLLAWFEDYNEVHPHSGLKFLPPRISAPQCLAQPATCPVKQGAHDAVRKT